MPNKQRQTELKTEQAQYIEKGNKKLKRDQRTSKNGSVVVTRIKNNYTTKLTKVWQRILIVLARFVCARLLLPTKVNGVISP